MANSTDPDLIFGDNASLGLSQAFDAEAAAAPPSDPPDPEPVAPPPFEPQAPRAPTPNPSVPFRPFSEPTYPYSTPLNVPLRRRRTSFFTRPSFQTEPQTFSSGPTPRTRNVPYGSQPSPMPGPVPVQPHPFQPTEPASLIGNPTHPSSSDDDTSSFATGSTSPLPPPPGPQLPVPPIPQQVPRSQRAQPPAPSRYNTTARTEAEMLRVAPIVAKESRRTLDNKAFQHLRTLATTPPSDTKFILPDPKSDEEILKRTQTISNLLDNLVRHLHKYDMLDCFHLVQPLQISPYGEVTGHHLLLNQYQQPVTLDLIHNYANIEERQVLASITFLRKYGQDFDLHNLDWSHELLINCCDAILSSKINERLSGYSVKTQGGPLFLYLMLQLIISTCEEASKALLARLDNLKIHQVEGGNVLTVVSLVRKAVDRLSLVHKLPDDIVEQLFDIFQTTSVKDFNSLFSAMKIQRRIDQRTLQLDRFTPEVIFETAQIAFTEFQEANKWVGFGQDQATFFVCYDCGKEGHYASKCPNKTKNNKNKKNKKGTPPAPSNSPHYNQDDPIFSTPPRDGCKVKSINGRDHFWCHHHQRWNQKHNTKSCPGPKRGLRNTDKAKRTPQANLAEKPKVQAPPPSATVSTSPSTVPTQEPGSSLPNVQFCLPSAPDSVSALSDSHMPVPSAPSIQYANLAPNMPRFDAYGRRLW